VILIVNLLVIIKNENLKKYFVYYGKVFYRNLSGHVKKNFDPKREKVEDASRQGFDFL